MWCEPKRPKTRVLALVGVLLRRKILICTEMEAWKGGPYRLPAQEMLRCKLPSILAAGVYCSASGLKIPSLIEITHGTQGPVLYPTRAVSII
jgi:hypothetical protein